MDILHNVSNLFKDSPQSFWLFCGLLGLSVGSFLNVVIHRLPKMMERSWQQSCLELQGQIVPAQDAYNLLVPSSHCPACEHRISALENIPLLSYLWLKGKCKQCKKMVSLRYPMVELLTGGLAFFVAQHYGYSVLTGYALLLVFALVALTFIDLDTQLLPDDITLPLLWLGLLVNFNHGFTDLKSAVIGAMAGYLILWLIFWLFKLLTGKEGMGYGDFKLLAAIGAWFGWKVLPAVILLSSVLGAIIGVGFILLKGKNQQTPIPFGPFLAMGAIAALFYDKQLMAVYFTG